MKSIRRIFDVLAVACMVFVLASCGGSKGEKYAKQINDATEKIKDAKSLEELQAIQTDLMPVLADMMKDAAENPDEFTDEDKAKLQEAGNAFDNAFNQKAAELQGASMVSPEVFEETEEVAEEVVPDSVA